MQTPASGSSDSENSRTTFIIKRWLDHRKIQIFQERRIRIFDRRFPSITTISIQPPSMSCLPRVVTPGRMRTTWTSCGNSSASLQAFSSHEWDSSNKDADPTSIPPSYRPAHTGNACKRGIKRHTGKTAPPVRQSVIRIRNQKEQPGSRLTGIDSLQHNQPARHRRESGPNLVIPTLQTIFVSSLERNLGLNDRRIRASVTKRDRIPFGNDPSGIQHLVIIEPLIHTGLRYTSQIRFESSFHLGKHKF